MFNNEFGIGEIIAGILLIITLVTSTIGIIKRVTVKQKEKQQKHCNELRNKVFHFVQDKKHVFTKTICNKFDISLIKAHAILVALYDEGLIDIKHKRDLETPKQNTKWLFKQKHKYTS